MPVSSRCPPPMDEPAPMDENVVFLISSGPAAALPDGLQPPLVNQKATGPLGRWPSSAWGLCSQGPAVDSGHGEVSHPARLLPDTGAGRRCPGSTCQAVASSRSVLLSRHRSPPPSGS